jgi:hypothetical protein
MPTPWLRWVRRIAIALCNRVALALPLIVRKDGQNNQPRG